MLKVKLPGLGCCGCVRINISHRCLFPEGRHGTTPRNKGLCFPGFRDAMEARSFLLDRFYIAGYVGRSHSTQILVGNNLMEHGSPDWHFARSMFGYRFSALDNGTDSRSWKPAVRPLRYLGQVRHFESQRRRYWPISSPFSAMARRTEITEDFCSIHCMDQRSPSFFSRAHSG